MELYYYSGVNVKEYFYEDFEVGNKFVTRARVITGSEIELIAALVGVTNPMFQSTEAAQKKGFKGKITPGAVIDAYAFGLEYQTGIYDNIVAVVEIDEMKFKEPLLHDSLLRSELEVIYKRETSRPDRGLVVFQRRCYVGDKEILEAKLKFLYFKRGSAQTSGQ